jgi:cyclophilin family peptidyl-prolyl cis-trans isomerase/HEAT repeat protein
MDVNDWRTVRRAAVVTAVGLYAAVYVTGVGRAAVRPNVVAAPDSALLQRMLDAEDSRAADSASLAPLFIGLRSDDATTRRIAARAIGRLERREYLSAVQPMVTDPSPGVRAEALNAIAQIAKADGASAPAGGDAQTRVWMSVQGLIRGLTASETDPVVRGAIARTLGRLPYPSEDVARAAAESIAALTDGVQNDGALAREPWFGVAHGIDDLLRRFPGVRTAPGVQRVAALPRVPTVANVTMDSTWSRETNVILASIRGRVLGAAVGRPNSVDEATARSVWARFLSDFGDADPQVRRQVVALVAVAGAIDDSARARVVNVALGDPSFSVRLEAVRAYARRRGASCAPLITSSRDANAHVALAAIDALGAPCEPSNSAIARLSQLVRELPRGATTRSATRGSWHLGAHAVVSLARVAPDSARTAIARFVAHPVWQVRMYAAGAAGELADTASLRNLASDRADNVRDAAVNAYSALIRSAPGANGPLRMERSAAVDSIFTSQLSRQDHQLLLDAAKALDGARSSARIRDALFATLDRLSARRSDNSRDPRMEMLARVESMGSGTDAPRIQPYLSDYDSAIAERAAQLLRTWRVPTAGPTPRRLPAIPVSLPDIGRLRGARVRVTMAPESGGRSFEIRLFVDETPASINRFVTLVRSGYYSGLTFHRVATNFVIQGGSPGANEYVGAERFMRDELDLRSHERGTVGISTRGRDTGDAQIFVNLIDNWRLDHDYTVMGDVVRGMDVVDAVLEGDVIARMEIVGAR